MTLGTHSPIALPKGVTTLSHPSSSRISTPSKVEDISPKTKQAVLRLKTIVSIFRRRMNVT